MTDDQMRRFAQWQDGLTLDIVEKSIPAIADDLADWYCRNHRPGWIRRRFRRRCAPRCSGESVPGAASGSRPDAPSTLAPVI